jgi:hypothetical protein
MQLLGSISGTCGMAHIFPKALQGRIGLISSAACMMLSYDYILPLFVEPISILCFVLLSTLVLALSALPHGLREHSFVDVFCLCQIASQPQSQILLRRILSFLVLTTRLEGYDNV